MEWVKENSERKDVIYLENHYGNMQSRKLLTEESMRLVAGICLDFAHLENEKRAFPEIYKKTTKLLSRYLIGCNHISAVREKKLFHGFDTHLLKNLNELDYLKKFPEEYFSDILSIELENSFEEQIKVKKYLENMLKIV